MNCYIAMIRSAEAGDQAGMEGATGRTTFPRVRVQKGLLLALAWLSAGLVLGSARGWPSDRSEPANVRTIRMVAGQYTPTADMVRSAINRYPHNAIRRIADEWEKLHPGYRIEFKDVPIGPNYIEWISAQCAAKTEPEIVFFFAGGQILAENGWAIPLDEYFERRNRYVPGNKRWRDLFYDAVFAPQWAFLNDGKFYQVAVDIFETVIYCNMNIFRKAGLVEGDGRPHQPSDWEDFFLMQEKIAEAGYTPFWSPAIWSWWPTGILGDMLYGRDVLERVDVLKRNGVVESDEINRAILKGIFSVYDPRYEAYMTIMKRWSQYWPKGFDLTEQAGHIDPFMLGRLGMNWSSVWGIVSILDDPMRDFEIATIYFPRLTTATTPLATGAPPPAVGSPGTTYYITDAAVRNGLVEQCVDWLMFLTTPRNIELLTQEKTNVKFPPAVRGVRVDPVLEPLMPILELPRAVIRVPWPQALHQEWYTRRVYEVFLKGTLPMAEAQKRLQSLLLEGTIDSIYNNQMGIARARWDLSRWGVNWSRVRRLVESDPRLNIRYGRFARRLERLYGTTSATKGD